MLRSICAVLVFGLACLHADVSAPWTAAHVLDFSLVPSGWPVGGTFFGSDGVLFSDRLTGAAGGTATNEGPFTYSFVTADFLPLAARRVGFSVRSNDAIFLQLYAYGSGGGLLWQEGFLIGSDYRFVGLEVGGGMDALGIDVPGVYQMQDFRFDLLGEPGGGGGEVVPEPAGVGLLAASVLGAICIWRCRRQSVR